MVARRLGVSCCSFSRMSATASGKIRCAVSCRAESNTLSISVRICRLVNTAEAAQSARNNTPSNRAMRPCKLFTGCILSRAQAIAQSALGKNQARPEFLAQTADQHFNGVTFDFRIEGVQLVLQLGLGQ